MGRYAARRLLVSIPTLFALSLFIFSLVSLAPGDPAEELARRRSPSGEVSEQDIERTRRELRLDRPFAAQYVSWLHGAVTGDMGRSFYKGTSVLGEIRSRVPATLELAAVALVLVVVMAVPLGVAAAMLHRHWSDHVMRFVALLFASVPGFFLAYVLIIVFATKLRLLPVAGRSGLDTLILPAVALAVGPIAVVSRLLRSSLLEVFGEDYTRTARGKGLTSLKVIVRHGLPNAAIPVTTYMGGLLAGLLEGVVIVELIFAWPGLGQLAFEAISQRDYPMIQAVVILAGAVYILMNLAVDVSYAVLDPRIRLEGSGEHG
ncbi:MAG TPA: ABC transporter permease [Acidimicrobiales bacterium]|nr:ABC transporter permease [Acidimicrobiales bacterium]